MRFLLAIERIVHEYRWGHDDGLDDHRANRQ